MSFSTLPLSYCTNVHPGQSVHEVIDGLHHYTAPMQERLGRPVAAGLWLAANVISEIRSVPDRLETLSDSLARHALICYTLNTFPFGNFHGERVKEQVYLPDWTRDARRQYTEQCAQVLAELMPEGTEGSLSTVPLGFKELPHGDMFMDECIIQLLKLARFLDHVHDETGRVIRLAIEPEPFCILETTPETIEFFSHLFDRAESEGIGDLTRRHLGVCYDVCHQSVEFEDVTASIADLAKAGIRINKVHITCALQLADPLQSLPGRQALASYAEPRYLHQTLGRGQDGTIHRLLDLDPAFCLEPPDEFAECSCWRVHFHVPVHQERIGPLETTRHDLREALAAVHQLDYAPHLEVETYTWGVLPGESRPDLVEGLTREMSATSALLSEIDSADPVQ